MPHKHTRKGAVEKHYVNLPPTEVAGSLPVSKSARANGIFTGVESVKRTSKKRKRKNRPDDDTPKAFIRLMSLQQGKRLPKSLDDGVKVGDGGKKRKVRKQEQPLLESEKATNNFETLKIRPGEKMFDFGARVDAALPVKGLINKSTRKGVSSLGLKEGQTRMEKRMHKMYDEWRREEAKRQEYKLKLMEMAEEEEMDEDGQVKWKVDMALQTKSKKDKKKKKKKKIPGEVDDGDDDPWAQILKNRGEKKLGIHDVAQAPPSILNVPKRNLKANEP